MGLTWVTIKRPVCSLPESEAPLTCSHPARAHTPAPPTSVEQDLSDLANSGEPVVWPPRRIPAEAVHSHCYIAAQQAYSRTSSASAEPLTPSASSSESFSPEKLQLLQDLLDLESAGEAVVWPDGLTSLRAAQLLSPTRQQHQYVR